jgi:hypothetical protein
MLKVDKLGANEYMRYVSLGPSSVSHKSGSAVRYTSHHSADLIVKNDTFRTLATDTQFKGKVKEDMLIRLLEAFVWKNHGKSPLKVIRSVAEIRIRAGRTSIHLCTGYVTSKSRFDELMG